LGQWCSSRSDLFPPEVTRCLCKLQSNGKPHSLKYTVKLIQESLNQPIETIFSYFGEKPVGVGAIAQVYHAKLHDKEQTDVAVKVLHPGVKAMVENDLKIMLMVATALEYIIPELHWLSLPDEVSMFSKMMQQQLDLRIESDNLITFIDNFGKWKQVGFPQPLQSTMNLNSHSDILIETWIDGIPLDHFLKWGPSTFDKKIATIGLTAFLKMLILDNHLHADLHPGNILVSFQKIDKDNFNSTPEFVSKSILMDLQHISNPSDWKSYLLSLEHEYEPFLYFIDAGLVSNLSSTHFTNFLDLFKAITEFDGQMISKLMVQRSKTPSTVRDFAGFSYSMGAFMKRIKKNTLALGEIYVSEILQFVFQTVRQHHVKIDGDFANVAVAILLLEGIGRQLEPEMDLLKASIPFLKQAFMARMDGDISSTESHFVTLIRSYLRFV
ncbi:ABC1 family-domain-containing protein, partial [Globomyces pollinis-pini]